MSTNRDWADEKAEEIVNAYRNSEKPLSEVIAAALRIAREEGYQQGFKEGKEYGEVPF